MEIVEEFALRLAMAWKADDIEKAALAKNSKAFGKQAEAKEKVKIHGHIYLKKCK